MQKEEIKTFLQKILLLNAVSISIVLAVYAYLGVFSRYIADDYCHSGLIKTNGFFGAVQAQYLTISNRYMILVIPYLTDLFGPRGQSLLPALMIVLWLIALVWLLAEVCKLLSLHWNKLIIFTLSGLLVFFVVLQAPARYQSIYWEASAVVHFIPFVLITFLVASVLAVVRKENGQEHNFTWSLFYFIIVFLIGGFSEMNDALIFALALLSLVSIFLWFPLRKGHKYFLSLWITSSIFISSLLSMAVMSLSPGVAFRVKQTPTIFVFLKRILTYPKDFIVDTLRTLPFPSMLTVLVPFLVFFLFYADNRKKTYKDTEKHIAVKFFAAPVVLYFLLIVNFSPSAYALAYPADRALLGARALMTLLLMIEGALLGIAFSQVKSSLFQSKYTRYLASAILVIFSFYPLRAAWQTIDTIDFYRQRAAAWDLRDSQIRATQEDGLMNIAVEEFDSLHGIKEIDSDPKHWVNRCAARYYGVETIAGIQ